MCPRFPCKPFLLFPLLVVGPVVRRVLVVKTISLSLCVQSGGFLHTPGDTLPAPPIIGPDITPQYSGGGAGQQCSFLMKKYHTSTHERASQVPYPGQFTGRVKPRGSGWVGSGRVRVTRPDAREFEKPPDLT